MGCQGWGVLELGGDFIVRCFNGNVAAMDPIMDPGISDTHHLRVFFGNLVQGTTSFFGTSQTGCGSVNGQCFIGANPVGWETLHADYWQTWQEGVGDVCGNGTDPSGPPRELSAT